MWLTARAPTSHEGLLAIRKQKLYSARCEVSPPFRVLDVGTGSGSWAIDFANRYVEADVIGTDLSPMHPDEVPVNFTFRTDNYLKPWLFCNDQFNLIHMRFLFGTVSDWDALFREAYRCCRPGGWVETCELDFYFCSDDQSIRPWHAMRTKWPGFIDAAALSTGSTFRPVELNVQKEGMERAGFIRIRQRDFKIPIGSWTNKDSLDQCGAKFRDAFHDDIEGFTRFIWFSVLRRPDTDYGRFVEGMKRGIRNPKVHSYFKARYVYGCKPPQMGE
ncbi:hypothetical protein ACRALDRAFT_1067939 [Sodiomyces alcalophilus JCM 7366]|uniref:uncharacterized protein n=1 Tax=Sodiomyces alcalophilus JCM 7366 TaxID=591952 RepID=UPI0039B3D763